MRRGLTFSKNDQILHKMRYSGVFSQFLSILFVFVLLSGVWGGEKAAPEKVSIVSWQYCFGCKQTVSLYSRLASAELQKMQRQGKPVSSILDAGSIVSNMCDNAEWSKIYQPFVHYSCVKIMTENTTQFLNHFAGSTTVDTFTNKADMYHRKRKVGSVYNT
ncbi:hypothetical protein EON65_55640 [archaeon]|nr:MAG: hypothetical protein EON65_55640 [archaeon]